MKNAINWNVTSIMGVMSVSAEMFDVLLRYFISHPTE